MPKKDKKQHDDDVVDDKHKDDKKDKHKDGKKDGKKEKHKDGKKDGKKEKQKDAKSEKKKASSSSSTTSSGWQEKADAQKHSLQPKDSLICVSTRENPDAGWVVEQTLGVVTGTADASTHAQAFQHFHSNEKEARAKATAFMRTAAEALGANAVLAVRQNDTLHTLGHDAETCQYYTLITVYGSAVKIVKKK
eukprot:CAMPEP_0201551660 /NCGR_PEP_ID=MMETSP0173_2-20130828/8732_1 /ASSEMBLY_ACC=CAM_ASM_000268 /TAXON_ID=218659 /ORGANISM="Vexillifera sp., Strain DIVA3 564/2" /LENGTH=191 /DNA_ID=CAMNT_0047961973 /DNA_START=23 /DNA_END=598 /DNA_ORIENTATION=+